MIGCGCFRVWLLECLFLSSNQFEAGEAQQELLAAGCLEGYCGSGVDAASLHLFHYSQTEAVVCNLLARLDGLFPGG